MYPYGASCARQARSDPPFPTHSRLLQIDFRDCLKNAEIIEPANVSPPSHLDSAHRFKVIIGKFIVGVHI